MTVSITVLGGTGFIGSHIVQRCRELSIECHVPTRDADVRGKHLHHVIYCIGITADFRSKPFETVEAHVCKLRQVLEQASFDSLLYVSSTRLYGTHATSAGEDDVIKIEPNKSNDLYNASKVLGECLTLNCGKPTRVARLSNIYGEDFASENFLSQLIRDAFLRKEIVLGTAPESEKDYLGVSTAADLLIKIAGGGRDRIYNVASGFNIKHSEIADILARLTGCRIDVTADAPTIAFPVVSVAGIKEEFNFEPTDLRADLESLVAGYRHALVKENDND